MEDYKDFTLEEKLSHMVYTHLELFQHEKEFVEDKDFVSFGNIGDDELYAVVVSSSCVADTHRVLYHTMPALTAVGWETAKTGSTGETSR